MPALPGRAADVSIAPGGPAPSDETDRIRIDVGPIARDVFRQLVPPGTNPNALTPELRQRIAAEINQRMTGIHEGLKLAAAELQRKADEARRKAADEAEAAAQDAKPAAPMKRHTAITGNRLAVTFEQNGKVVRAANAEINLPNVLMTVFSSMPRGQGDVPFAVGKDGRIYTPTTADRAALDVLTPARLPNGSSMLGEWVVVMTPDPTGSGLRLGIARPVGDSLADLRRTAGRNAGLGLLFIGLSLVLHRAALRRGSRTISPRSPTRSPASRGASTARACSSSRRTRLGSWRSRSTGWRRTSRPTSARIAERERLKRELELGRQIQQDMQPQQPLRLGLTEIQGISVPAREVGGDFFNYFVLPDGQVALLVGDVAGKGVGAALLMANIQASLRTRFALGQDLSAIADAIDRDIEANSPGPMYATHLHRHPRLPHAPSPLRQRGPPPAYVLRLSGGLERMGATGLPAGLLAGRGYTEEHVELERGDVISLLHRRVSRDGEQPRGDVRIRAARGAARCLRPHRARRGAAARGGGAQGVPRHARTVRRRHDDGGPRRLGRQRRASGTGAGRSCRNVAAAHVGHSRRFGPPTVLQLILPLLTPANPARRTLVVGRRTYRVCILRHRRARRYLLRVGPDETLRLTVPRSGTVAAGLQLCGGAGRLDRTRARPAALARCPVAAGGGRAVPRPRRAAAAGRRRRVVRRPADCR